ncbi:hypothetical protein J6590_034242 [Homalodisca vitripennis]|nr:hypothetical protein J6590_034242 [Homalodisca vitripennis]
MRIFILPPSSSTVISTKLPPSEIFILPPSSSTVILNKLPPSRNLHTSTIVLNSDPKQVIPFQESSYFHHRIFILPPSSSTVISTKLPPSRNLHTSTILPPFRNLHTSTNVLNSDLNQFPFQESSYLRSVGVIIYGENMISIARFPDTNGCLDWKKRSKSMMTPRRKLAFVGPTNTSTARGYRIAATEWVGKERIPGHRGLSMKVGHQLGFPCWNLPALTLGQSPVHLDVPRYCREEIIFHMPP